MLKNTLLIKKKHLSSKRSLNKAENNKKREIVCFKIKKKEHRQGIKSQNNKGHLKDKSNKYLPSYHSNHKLPF